MGLGRPRSFDIEEALECATEVFWRKGYEGASLADLTAAMGINSPSLYAAFGNKEGLFRAVLDRYSKKGIALLNEALAAPTARECAERFLDGVVNRSTDPKNPPGCLYIQGGLSCGESAGSIPADLARCRAQSEQALLARFKRAKADGDLAANADAMALARYLIVTANGICIQATAGAKRNDLIEVVRLALTAWPAGPKAKRKPKRGARISRRARHSPAV